MFNGTGNKRLRRTAQIIAPSVLAVGVMSALPYVKEYLMKKGVPEKEAEKTATEMLQGKQQLPSDIQIDNIPWYKKITTPMWLGIGAIGAFIFYKKG